MVKVDSPDWEIMSKCAGSLIILHHTLYSALKLTYPTDVGEIVLEGRITSEMDAGSLARAVSLFVKLCLDERVDFVHIDAVGRLIVAEIAVSNSSLRFIYTTYQTEHTAFSVSWGSFWCIHRA